MLYDGSIPNSKMIKGGRVCAWGCGLMWIEGVCAVKGEMKDDFEFWVWFSVAKYRES